MAILYNPRQALAWNNKGLTQNKIGKHIDAIRCFDKAKDLEHKMLDIWCNKGVAFSLLGWLKEALECFDMAIDIEPEEDMSTVESIAYLRTVLQWPGITKG